MARTVQAVLGLDRRVELPEVVYSVRLTPMMWTIACEPRYQWTFVVIFSQVLLMF